MAGWVCGVMDRVILLLLVSKYDEAASASCRRAICDSTVPSPAAALARQSCALLLAAHAATIEHKRLRSFVRHWYTLQSLGHSASLAPNAPVSTIMCRNDETLAPTMELLSTPGFFFSIYHIITTINRTIIQ